MINTLRIFNYKSFKDIKLKLKPLNILIGPNGCGKSNFIDIFSLLGSGAKGELLTAINSRGGFDTVRFKGKSKTNNQFGFNFVFPVSNFEGVKSDLIDAGIVYDIYISDLWNGVTVENERLSIVNKEKDIILMDRKPGECFFVDEGSLRILKGGDVEGLKKIDKASELAIYQVRDKVSYPTAYQVNKYLEEIKVYTPFDISPEAVVRRPQLVRPGTKLVQSGANLVSVLHSIKENHHEAWNDILEILQNIYPGFKNLSLPPEGGDGKIVIRWSEKPFEDLGFSINMISDGTIRLLLLLALLKSPDPPPLICIDEPEIGLHPSWIKLVGELLEEASTRTQLIVATHSAELVSKMKPENVIVCEKEDGATVMERLDEKELSEWLEKYTLGDLWLSGHFGG